ncbi:Uncharacterized protein PECH_007536 [Penicillium ucsense]|uniref:SMP-LTD domain-containing protein n=1 Tax=Penicillium ucsense TaxID=2839758 RepID=A0A8J8WL13_9EURO|nr:Uncharacterized protein PECM_004432 [Penicillium ucsense]KAF7738835.1 Uncharacterized protein PECH_007536 [Penicillium ucsense]
MGPLISFVAIYVLGGLTFIPLVLSIAFLYAYLTFPSVSSSARLHRHGAGGLRQPDDDEHSLKSGTDHLAEEFHRAHDSEVATGYFAVCREYVPGGVNGKPPERTTPAGEVVATESPSVYQTMYRSLFDRKQAPSIEPAKLNGKNVKRARNVFYIVLRHGHLMLYDDANQVDVRYVISLAHHDVTIHSGEGDIPEGELWIKRNAICLSRRLDSLGDLGGPTPPFFLFSENLSEKEDFYLALLRNQSKLWNSADRPPKRQDFDTKHVVSLVQRLHSSEEQMQTRWINALIGRLFLALYRTRELEHFIGGKIAKKISRVNKPNFISKIGLQKIDMGEGAPFLTNPRLKDLTVDGSCCVEADVQYAGNFRLEISVTVRIDLGQRFKAREVDIVLAVVLKKMEGHMLLRFKPPPSNRLWMSFESMPKIEMDIQPIVSSKQITFSPILRAIESRIREVVAESVVLPFWDDIPFMDTHGQAFRGGIWQRESDVNAPPLEIPDESESAPATTQGLRDAPSLESLKVKDERIMSTPSLSEQQAGSGRLKSRKTPNASTIDLLHGSSGTSTSVEKTSDSLPLPRAIRSQTFSNAAHPIVTTDNANKVLTEVKSGDRNSATSAMIEISKRSPPTSPRRTPSSSPPSLEIAVPENAIHSRSSSIAESIDGVSLHSDQVIQTPSSARFENTNPLGMRSLRGNSSSSLVSEKSRRRSTIETLGKQSDEKSIGNVAISNAAAAAKKWSWSVFGKGETNHEDTSRSSASKLDVPIGRGHPHPLPGAPLPRPDKFALKRNSGTLPKRKPVGTQPSSPDKPTAEMTRPVPPPPLPRRKTSTGPSRPVPPPPLPQRKPVVQPDGTGGSIDNLLVVQAPHDSAPDSPATGELDLEDTLTESSLMGTDARLNAGDSRQELHHDHEDIESFERQPPSPHSLPSSVDSSNASPPKVSTPARPILSVRHTGL